MNPPPPHFLPVLGLCQVTSLSSRQQFYHLSILPHSLGRCPVGSFA
jgi:hypothetical protein